LLTLFCALPVVALFNVFGQAPHTTSAAAAGGAATLSVETPANVRGGDLFQARFDIRARKEIKDAVLVLDPGWFNSLTINTIEPAASKESSKDGKLAFDLGDIPSGKLWTEFLELQVNPVNLGSQTEGAALYDGNVQLARVNHSLRIWP